MWRLGAGFRALAARAEQVGMRWMNEHLLEFFLLDVFFWLQRWHVASQRAG